MRIYFKYLTIENDNRTRNRYKYLTLNFSSTRDLKMLLFFKKKTTTILWFFDLRQSGSEWTYGKHMNIKLREKIFHAFFEIFKHFVSRLFTIGGCKNMTFWQHQEKSKNGMFCIEIDDFCKKFSNKLKIWLRRFYSPIVYTNSVLEKWWPICYFSPILSNSQWQLKDFIDKNVW